MDIFKVIRMAKRPLQQSAEAFRQEWKEAQVNVSPAPARTVLSLATGEVALGGQTPPFDGMAALYYRTPDEARSAGASMKDETVQVCDEYLMSQKPKPQTRLKIIRTVYRRRDLTHAQFKDYWLKNHARLEERVIAESPVQRIVATFAMPQAGKDPAFDGMVELYFASMEDIRSMFSGPIPAMMRKDEENFVQMDAPAVRLVAEEFIV